MATTEASQWRRLWVLCLSAALLLRSVSATEEEPPNQPAPATAAATVGKECAAFSGTSCDQCILNTSCLWCSEQSTCMDYPVRNIIPSSTLCPLSDAFWGVCWVSLQALIISLAVIAGLLLLTIAGCCCCCCYCRGHRRGYYFPFLFKRAQQTRLAEEEERFIREQEEKRLQSLQRRLERKAKHEKIRKKYGLLPDSEHPYSRYENE